MGIRFSCHGCGKPLNIKTELAGRRGVCPDCQIRFRIPLKDAEYSTPIESGSQSASVSTESAVGSAVAAVLPEVATGSAAVAEPQAGEFVSESADLAQPSPVPTSTTPTAAQPSPSVASTTGSIIDALASDSDATWYVRPPSGGQYGPATGEVLKSWIEEGRVARNALLWRDGWLQWRDASEALPEIASTLPGGGNEGALSEGQSLFPQDAAASVMAPAVTQVSPIGSANNVDSSAVNSGALSGNSDIGSVRRRRSSNRLTLIAVLGVVVVGLCITLAVVASMSG
ncbi:MAG: GYF domain-containing protein [Planctomycetota bacterium]